MMSGAATPAQIGGLLMALRVRGETVEEIAGAAARHAREGAAQCARRTAPSTRAAPAATARAPSTSRPARPSWWPAPACRSPSTATARSPRARLGRRAGGARRQYRACARDDRALHRANAGSASCSRRRITPPCAMSRRCASSSAPAPSSICWGRSPIRPAPSARSSACSRRQWVEPIAQVLGAARHRARLGGAWQRRAGRAHHHRRQRCRRARRTARSDLRDLAERCRACRDARAGAISPAATAAENAAAHPRRARRRRSGAYRDIVLLNAGAALMVAGKADDLRDGVGVGRGSRSTAARRAGVSRRWCR